MKYSFEYKRQCVEMYKQGIWPEVPDGIKNPKDFKKMVRLWSHTVDNNGILSLRHTGTYRKWSADEKFELVSKVMAGNSIRSIACEVGINPGMLYNWVHKYKIYGYNGLIPKQKGRKSKDPDMKKVGTRKPPKPNESEYEELIRLRAENEYMKAEIEVIKKEIALREEKEAARLKAKKQRSSRNSVPKDSN